MNLYSDLSQQPKAVYSGSGNGIDDQKLKDFINLNQVFQLSLKLYHGTISKSVPIIRCDQLPSVYGDPAQMQRLFNLLFQLVFSNQPTTSSKSFIYVKCELEKEDVIDLTIKKGFQKYRISIHSNNNQLKELINDFEEEISEIKNIFTNFSGSFNEHIAGETGCLFTIIIFGKIN